MDLEDEYVSRLARNLCVAFIANQLGVTLATADRKHVSKDKPVGEYWHEVARMMVADYKASKMLGHGDKPVVH